MADDDVDYELLELLRQRLGINKPSNELSSDTGVLKDAEYIYNNAVDVSIDMWLTKSAALKLHKIIQERGYSIAAWSEHELHPRLGPLDEVEMANFVFTMDLLNFSFWSELSEQDRFQVEYKGKRYTGYMTLVASLQRALEEGIPITTPRFWRSAAFTDDLMKHIFRSATAEEIPLLEERILVLREAGQVLKKDFDDEPDDNSTVNHKDRGRTTLETPIKNDGQESLKIAGKDIPSAIQTSEEHSSQPEGGSATHAEVHTIQPAGHKLVQAKTGNHVDAVADDDRVAHYSPSIETNAEDLISSEGRHLAQAEADAQHDTIQATTGQRDAAIPSSPSTGTPADDTARPQDHHNTVQAKTNAADVLPVTDDTKGLQAPPTGNSSAVASYISNAITKDDTVQPDAGAADGTATETDASTVYANTSFTSRSDKSVQALILKANRSAGKLVNLLVKHFLSFRDECRYDGRKVRLLKRAQIFVADLNAACKNQGLGHFSDMDCLTMFADYRVPQILHRFGVLSYCPALSSHIGRKLALEHRGSWEVQIRGCAIWATELLRREICRQAGAEQVNAVLIDFLLYDLAKEVEFTEVVPALPLQLQLAVVSPTSVVNAESPRANHRVHL